MDPLDPDDPKGLIRESFRIDGIGEAECRMILIDWALSLPASADYAETARRLAARDRPADHPMTALLRAAGATGLGLARRRGGRAARFAAEG
ncbi:MAG: hypothetical protein ACK4GT_17600 [Pararhodobacter sp.]